MIKIRSTRIIYNFVEWIAVGQNSGRWETFACNPPVSAVKIFIFFTFKRARSAKWAHPRLLSEPKLERVCFLKKNGENETNCREEKKSPCGMCLRWVLHVALHKWRRLPESSVPQWMCIANSTAASAHTPKWCPAWTRIRSLFALQLKKIIYYLFCYL